MRWDGMGWLEGVVRVENSQCSHLLKLQSKTLSYILPPAASYLFSLTMANPGTHHQSVPCIALLAISLVTGLHAPRQRCAFPANYIARSGAKVSLCWYTCIGTCGLQPHVPRRSRSLSRVCCQWPACTRKDKAKVGFDGTPLRAAGGSSAIGLGLGSGEEEYQALRVDITSLFSLSDARDIS